MKRDVPVNIYIVDSISTYERGLYSTLSPYLNISVRRFLTGELFIEYMKEHGVPSRRVHIAIVAFQHVSALEYVMNGLEILEVAKRVSPRINVIMVGQQEDLEFGVQAHSAGAFGVVRYTQCTSLQLFVLILRIVGPLRKEIRVKQLVSIVLELAISVAILGVCLTFWAL